MHVVAMKPVVDGAEVSNQTIELSVVMPCLNEARTVAICIRKALQSFDKLGVVGEVIVADNGSTDGSQAIAEAVGARVVPVYRRGYGAALRGGIDAAAGTYVVMGDADDSYDFADLAGFLGRLRAGDDLVMGNRFKGGIRPGAMPWHHRYVGNPVLTGVLNLFYRTGVGDAHCGLRAFRKDAFDRMGLTTPGMEFASEMVVRAALLKLKVREVPVVLYPDGRDRPPHLRSFRDGWRHLRFLLLFCPLWLFVVPAAVLMAVGLGLMTWLTPGTRYVGTIGLDVHTMVAGTLALILGHQVVWLGLFAKELGHRSGALPADPLAGRVAACVTLERGLGVAAALLVAGLGMLACLVAEWWTAAFGSLDAHGTMRYALWGLTGVAAAAQVGFGVFFLDLIRCFTAPTPSTHG